jgi:ADP-sugar diphosphatase
MEIANIALTGADGIDVANVAASKQFTDWLKAMDADRFVVKSVHFQSVDMFGPKIGFIKFKADVSDKSGKFVPGIIFMRGGSVGILCVLSCEGKRYTVLTVQPRVATGRFDFVEIPAGMLDGSGNFKGVAAAEMEQELGLKIADSDLFDLSAQFGHDKGFYVSPGGTDETIRLFVYEQDVTAEQLAEMQGKCTGLIEEGEQITLRVTPLDDSLLNIEDGKTIVAYALYEAHVKSRNCGATTNSGASA